MYQIVDYNPSLQARLNIFPSQRHDFDNIAVEESRHELATALCALSLVYSITDALDEISLGNDEFIERLERLVTLNEQRLKSS